MSVYFVTSGQISAYFGYAIALATFAAFVEVVQLFAPGRHARLSDFAIDALAAIIGLIVAGLLGLIRAPS